MKRALPLWFLPPLVTSCVALAAACSSQAPGTPPVPPACPEPQIACTDGCRDTATDPSDCGECGSVCGSPGQCLNSACVPPPGPGPVDVGGHVVAPTNPKGPAPSGGPVVLAVKTLYLGDTDANGQPSISGWADYGLDIDGVVTTAASKGTCQPLLPCDASPLTPLTPNPMLDGYGGIDNSFGENLLPYLLSVSGSDFPARLNASIGEGKFTLLISVDALGPGQNAAPVTAYVVGGAPVGKPPQWSGTDVWPIDDSTLGGTTLQGANLAFSGSYMNDRTLVASPPSGAGTLPLDYALDAFPALRMPITHLQVLMVVSADGMTARGILSGIIPVNAYLAYLHTIAGDVTIGTDSLCTDPLLEQVVQGAADILVDGSVDPTRPCDGISIGVGFDAVAALLGPVIITTAHPDTCN